MRITHTSRLVLGLIAPSTLMAIEPCEVATLTGNPGECFGAGVGINGDYVVVGDPCDSTMAQEAGAAYVFRRRPGLLSWEPPQKIFGTGINFQDTFGQSVAVDGDRVVVGAPHYDLAGSGFGYAYVFQRVGESWIEQQKLISSGSANDDSFGASVSISGDWIAVGAPGQADYFGRVVLFRWNGSTFVEEASLVGADTVQWNGFGSVVAIRQDRLVVGVPSAIQEHGKVYILRREGDNWIEETGLSAGQGVLAFGGTVSLDGERIIVGPTGTNQAGLGTGSAYVFRRNGTAWTEEAILQSSQPQAAANFGDSVAISGPFALVGEPYHHVSGTDNIGRVYLFQNEGGIWNESVSFAPRETAPGLAFGRPIAFDGVYAVIDSSYTTYVYTVPNCIPTMGAFDFCILAGLLVIAGVVLLRRGNLSGTHYDDS